jgi:AcrR family transcriptional regulator
MDETREALVRAAAREFAARGLDGPSLDRICARAGFTRGAFYVHFRSREDLLAAVMERVYRRFLDLTLGGLSEDDDLRALIVRYGEAIARGSTKMHGKPWWRFHHTLSAVGRSPEVRERFVSIQQEAKRRVAEIARRGQRAGTVRRDIGADLIATVITAEALGLAVMLDAGIPFDPGALQKALVGLFGRSRPEAKVRSSSSRSRRNSRSRSRTRAGRPASS